MKKYFTFSVLLRIVTACLLFWAIFHNPYDYYIILRWITFGVSLYCIYIAYGAEKKEWLFLFGMLSFIFNPIIPLHLSKDIWRFIDVISGIFLIVSMFFVKERD